MSDQTNKDFYNEPRYVNRHVGGRIQPVSDNYVKQQMDLIRNSKTKLPPQHHTTHKETTGPNSAGQFVNQNVNLSRSLNTGGAGVQTKKGIYLNNNERFDPYDGYLNDRGLLDDGTNRRRFKTFYINIDSRFRDLQPSSTTEDTLLLANNPLDFQPNSNVIFIRHEGHPYEEGDLITLDGATSVFSIRRTFDDNNIASFFIPAGCNIMRVNYQHGLPEGYSGDEIEVTFSGIRGDTGTIETSSYLGNIPTNILNSTYPIQLTLSEDDLNEGCELPTLPDDFLEYSPDYFFVVLPVTMQAPSSGDPYVLRTYNYRLTIEAIGGVPLNRINARYPIDPDHLQGFHKIFDVRSNGYSIETPISAVIDINGGGKCIYVAKVDEVRTGYPRPNQYTIDLGRTFHDVISARLVSMEFPNTQRAIKDETSGRGNNKIYWNDIDDGDFLYSIEIPPGNYTPAQLVEVMEGLFFETPRENSGDQFGYTPNHYIQVEIDDNTDIVTFTSYKEFILVEPIDTVTPEISQDSALDSNPADTQYVLTINHPQHGMTQAGERILIANTIEHLGIPTTVVNTEHEVIEIVSPDSYKIILPRFNLGNTREDTKGGVAVTIFIPDLFRLRFDEDDTMGTLLGFRNPGNPNSVYEFSREIQNQEPYAFDTGQNSLGQDIVIEQNALQLSGDNYVIMVARPFETFIGIGPVKSGFAKIILCDVPGNMLYNSYVQTSRFYEDPVNEVSEIEVEFFSPDGNLFDFNGLNHSFTIELVTVHDIPGGTGINSNTGKNYNIVGS